MKINWNNPAKEYLLYALLLGITLLYPFLHMGEKALDGEAFQWSYLFQQWVKTLPFVVLLLIHIFVLLPVLLDKKQTGKYILKVSGPVIIDTLIGVLLLGCSLAIKLMFKHTESIRKMNELENFHIKQELEQLRTQVSPHFLMNSLNNIHGMVEMDKQKAQDMILELSGMMRYMLYESSVPMISLSREIDFLSNYISLMRARYNSNRVVMDEDTYIPVGDSYKELLQDYLESRAVGKSGK